MKQKLLLGILLFSILSLSSQTITVERSYRLFDGDRTGFYPVFNADGSLLAFTGDGYAGLDVFNFADGSVIHVTQEQGAGFDPVFTDDGRIFFRNVVRKDRLRFEGVQSFDLQTRTVREVIEPQRNLRRLQSFGNSVTVAVDDNRLLRASFQENSEPVSAVPYVWSDGQNLNIQRNGQSQRLNPVEGANGYIWATLSPNRQMISFIAVGKGAFISDLDGNIISSLGHFSAPVWFGDEFIVGMIDEDDGHVITGSRIVMKSIDGSVSQTLSPPNQIAMFPAASSAASKVAYNTADGIIYILELNIIR